MRAVIQRVNSAKVTLASDGTITGEIGHGLLILLGVYHDDTPETAAILAAKIAGLRIFDDVNGKMNLALNDVGGSILVVSQFTLYADCRRGRRPSFTDAASPQIAEQLYVSFVEQLRKQNIEVQTGKFQTGMNVELVNSGPVTLIIDTDTLK
ncbi:MAG: D-tyrosyl-tRNA(Tyr) deacylase [Planctomycetaceae bacterium]|jgi:D-tyrosyl-tRNA(Tyr) deacylase|nr:D-tyrosyl-tRNA(Tyr) deacylase [Planctomycetaceae bacterium]